MSQRTGFVLIVQTSRGTIEPYPCFQLQWGPEAVDAIRRHWDLLRECGGYPPVALVALSRTGKVLRWWSEPSPALQMAVASYQADLEGARC